MHFKVSISAQAEKNLDAIVLYLETEWPIRVRKKFLHILGEKIDLLSRSPFLYEASSKKKSVRRCVVTKQVALFYRVLENEIEIISIQDTRQDPNKLKL